MSRPILYEINTRCWLVELSETAGKALTLAEVPDRELKGWSERGFTHIWLMGVWTLGARGQAWSEKCYAGREDELRCRDIAGSPYAIQNYSVSMKLGGDDGLAAFRRRLHQHGLKLLLDFVPNHTALDHPWAREHPEYFVTSSSRRRGSLKPFPGASRWFAHGDCGHGSPWVDTLQVDYRNPELRAAMMRELLSIASRCDGVRCDMAMLAINEIFARTWKSWPHSFPDPPAEFWREAIAAVKRAHPDFLLVAEAYWDREMELQQLGFDFTYNKRVYDRIVGRDTTGLSRYLRALAPGFLARSTHFIENHDEPRIASLLSPKEHRAAAFLVAVLPGMPLFHEGQFSGSRVHANVHFSRRSPESADMDLTRWYDRLFAALSESAVGHGSATILEPMPAWEGNPSHENFVLIHWPGEGSEFDLAVVNLAGHASQCFAPILHAKSAENWKLLDRLGSEQHERSGDDLSHRGLYLDLGPQQARLFRFMPKPAESLQTR